MNQMHLINRHRNPTVICNTAPIIREIRATGASMRRTATALNTRGIPTARGGVWAATQVSDILKRVA
jgi:hypothetical protein